ncbi:alpha/beta fold hydrolase [Streptomyces katsurahamanus]|uniref:alpha/beta fold hydrolase n=1 Tax=Streptomyces katsurahamanus TaxID=2577098 RepID=UPI002B1EEA5D|nr:alpha/beta hydrolase [Streptomyces katsurahamanus]
MTLAYDITGTGPTAVLLHSTVCDRRMWDPQRQALADSGLRVVRCDFRGYGETPAGDAPYRDADDVLDLLDALGVEQAALVGASYGGRAALALAARAPHRVSALALLCPALPGEEPSARLTEYDRRETELFEAEDFAGAAELNAEVWLGPEADATTRAAVAEMQLNAFRRQLAATEEHDGAEDIDISALAAVHAPVLAVSGAHDMPDFRTPAARLPELLPRAVHRELPWAGHLPSLERPSEITGLLTEFLRSGVRRETAPA